MTSNISTYLDCFELEKFEPVDSEEQLSKRGLELLETNQLWGGLVRTSSIAVQCLFSLRKCSKCLLRCLLDLLLASRSCQSLSPTRFGSTRTRWDWQKIRRKSTTYYYPGGQHKEIRGPTESSRASKKTWN